jgi:NAD-dependent dihydropyrimidine dehydrogenase PreA subunit
MAYVITDACIMDFLCAAECATAAITPASADDAAAAGITHLFINPDECIDCGNCASICPSGAIFAEDDLPAEKAYFAAKNKAYFN